MHSIVDFISNSQFFSVFFFMLGIFGGVFLVIGGGVGLGIFLQEKIEDKFGSTAATIFIPVYSVTLISFIFALLITIVKH